MSKWGWAAFWGAFAVGLALAITSVPNSYAHLFLSGKCFATPMPRGCVMRMGRRG